MRLKFYPVLDAEISALGTLAFFCGMGTGLFMALGIVTDPLYFWPSLVTSICLIITGGWGYVHRRSGIEDNTTFDEDDGAHRADYEEDAHNL